MATTCDPLVASPDRHALMMRVDVGAATAQIRRNIGLFSANYDSAKAVTNSYMELLPGESVTGPKTNALFIKTSGQITFAAVRPSPQTPLTYSVSKLHFLDYPVDSFTITNATSSTIRLQLAYAAPVPGQTDTPIQSPVLTVNGNAPDADGNVTVDTGVMTVNSIAPGTQGIPGDVNVTDEGIIS